jgi:hypothetical protein
MEGGDIQWLHYVTTAPLGKNIFIHLIYLLHAFKVALKAI